MQTLDTVTPSLAGVVSSSRSAASDHASSLLAQTFASLNVENHYVWAWDNYKRVVQSLTARVGAKRLVEIGGGRDPLFNIDEIERLGVEMTVNDIAPGELAVLPSAYQTACFDVAGDPAALASCRGQFDLAFSRMVFEHVADGKKAWSNLYELLSPGGVALTFIPTLYSLPFVLNLLLPDRLAASVVKMVYAKRTDAEDPVFPAYYSWCFTDDRLNRMLSDIGYREILVLPFYGHHYYQSFPLVRDVGRWMMKHAQRNDWRAISSHAYVAVRK
jgi:SAM-dependent methyltransferase